MYVLCLGAYQSGYAISIIKKSCAVGYYTFGQMLGQNFGADHDIRVSPKPFIPYGRGHLILPTGSTYRTILAYGTTGHWNRVNYYSSPHVIFPATGTPTGIAGVSNNARVITENRFKIAALGDESGSCGGLFSMNTLSSNSAIVHVFIFIFLIQTFQLNANLYVEDEGMKVKT